MSEPKWRVGKRVGLNVYSGDRAVCQCHNEEDARLIVDAVNARIENPPRCVDCGKTRCVCDEEV